MSSPETPFFFRQSTIDVIRTIADSDSMVIYAGAGVTIDRTGLDWGDMVGELLARSVPNEETRAGFIRMYGPLFAASAAHQLFRLSDDDLKDGEAEVRQRISDVLGVMLYAAEGWRYGELVTAIAEAVMVWNLRTSRGRRREVGAKLATTNYDDYLMLGIRQAYKRVQKRRKESFLPPPKLIFPTDSDPLSERSFRLANWIRKGLPTDVTPCLYLHGRIPKSSYRTPRRDTRFPVVSEVDYHLTSSSSEKALTALFGNNNVLIVGSSLTDPPMLRALEQTKIKARNAKLGRWALIVTGQIGDYSTRREYEELIGHLLRALDVIPVFADFYVQLSQFFRELATARQSDNEYASSTSARHYQKRLDSWWLEWAGSHDEEFRMRRQLDDQYALDQWILKNVRSILDAGEDERLKIEIWVRWNPGSSRKMRLWASTTQIWTSEEAMREVDIGEDADSAVVQAFRAGRAVTRSLTDRKSGRQRWSSLLAVPFWLTDIDESQKFIIGVLLIASARPLESAAFGARANRRSLAELIEYAKDAGGSLVSEDASLTR